MAAPSTWTKLRARSRGNWRGRTGENYIIDYAAPVGQTFASVFSAFPKWQPYPGTTGIFRPLLEDVEIEVERAPDDQDLVRLHYLTPTWWGVLKQNPDKARLLATVNEVAVRPDYDLDGKAVWAEKWKKVGSAYKALRFRPISGSGLQHHARTMLRLQVMATSGVLGTILDLHDSINAGAMGFGAGPGTVRMAGAHTETVMSEAALTFLDAVMEYNKKGWNKDTEVQMFEWRIHKMQLYDAAGVAISNSYRDVGDWFPVAGEGSTRIAKLHESEDWSGLNRQIIWT